MNSTVEQAIRSGEGSPQKAVEAALSAYFADNSVTLHMDANDWIANGAIIRVRVTRIRATLQLTHDMLGIPDHEWAEMPASRMSLGKFRLVPEAIDGKLDSLEVQARERTRRYGISMPKGDFVLTSAMPKFEEDWNKIVAQWNATIDEWATNFDQYRAEAEANVRHLAEGAYRMRHKLEGDVLLNRDDMKTIDIYAEQLRSRLMPSYPSSPEEIRSNCGISFSRGFVATPNLVEAQNQWVESMRARGNLERSQIQAEIEQLERDRTEKRHADELEILRLIDKKKITRLRIESKLATIAKVEAETRQELLAEAERLKDAFGRFYAVELRQRLSAALSFALEGVEKGKMSKSAGRSLKDHVLGSIKWMVLEEDVDMQQMLARIEALLPKEGDKDSAFTVEHVGAQIRDLGTLLNLSILGLGGEPRMPRTGKDRVMEYNPVASLAASLPLADDELFAGAVRTTRERLGFEEESLAESLIGAGVLTTETLTRRTVRAPETLFAE